VHSTRTQKKRKTASSGWMVRSSLRKTRWAEGKQNVPKQAKKRKKKKERKKREKEY
jgi:hypothetical protein